MTICNIQYNNKNYKHIMNTIVVNWKPLYSNILGRIIRPEEQYNLIVIKQYLRDTLTGWVNELHTFANIINNPTLRTSQNIFFIIERLLELFNSVDAYMWDKSNIPNKIFSPKNLNFFLLWTLWKDIEIYENNPDQLLQDLDIIDAYYKRSNPTRIISDRESPVITKAMKRFHEAFEIVIRNEIKDWIRKPKGYQYVNINEFQINKQWNIQFSERVSPATINIPDIVHKIQQVMNDLNLLES